LVGGYGFSGTMGFFTGMLHIPAPLAFLAICAEFLAASDWWWEHWDAWPPSASPAT